MKSAEFLATGNAPRWSTYKERVKWVREIQEEAARDVLERMAAPYDGGHTQPIADAIRAIPPLPPAEEVEEA